MLAKTFKTANELNVTQEMYDALRKVLENLESGKLKHTSDWRPTEKYGFNMNVIFVEGHCGTAGCILGWASHYTGKDHCLLEFENKGLHGLFYPDCILDYVNMSTQDAAYALRKFLETGVISWSHYQTYVK